MPSAESRLRGVFPVLQSPFDDADRLDLDALGAEVEFCRRAGVHGVVYPAIASEFQYLTDDERCAGVEAVVGAAAGAIPVVAGVAAASRRAGGRICRVCRARRRNRRHGAAADHFTGTG